MSDARGPSSGISQAYPDRVEVRGRDLTGELMGKLSFTEYFYLLLTGREANEEQPGRAGILSLLAGGSASDATQAIVAKHGVRGLVGALDWLGSDGRTWPRLRLGLTQPRTGLALDVRASCLEQRRDERGAEVSQEQEQHRNHT